MQVFFKKGPMSSLMQINRKLQIKTFQAKPTQDIFTKAILSCSNFICIFPFAICNKQRNQSNKGAFGDQRNNCFYHVPRQYVVIKHICLKDTT